MNDKICTIESNLWSSLFPFPRMNNKESFKELTKNLARIWQAYNQERGSISSSLFSSENLARSYALYYAPVNSAKILHVFKNIINSDFHPKSLLDFGSGPGTSTLAALNLYPNLQDVTLVEHAKGMRNVAELLIKPNVKNFTQIEKIPDSDQKYDLIVCANSINEIPINKREELLFQLIDKLEAEGFFIILEPGNLKITRELMTLKDNLVSTVFNRFKNLSIYYPCTHHNPCQLLNNKNEWCHTEINYQRSETIRRIDNELGLNKDKIHFSCLVLKNSLSENQQKLFRVIKDPIKNKIGVSTYICGSDYQGFVRISKRSRSENNKYFEKLSVHEPTLWNAEFEKINHGQN